MATTSSLDAVLLESGLVERSALESSRTALAQRGEEPTDDALAEELVRRKQLTRWQADELLAGRDDGLLIGGRYLVLEPLGRGGMGEVYKARHTRIPGRLVALKVLARQKMSDPKALSRFQREVTASGRLDHPNLVRTLDVDQHGEAEILVLEYIEGEDLARRVRTGGPLPWPQVVEIGRQMARGLAFAHEAGIVHRDIKPPNVMLARDGTVKILDMGLARLLKPEFVGPRERELADSPADRAASDSDSDDMLTHSGLVMGTVDFMAPEQARDTRLADHRSDLYALGATLYFCLTGRSPLAGGNITNKLTRLQLESPPPLADRCPDAPADLVAVVERLLAKRPEDRFRTAADVAAALDGLTSSPIHGAASGGPAGNGHGSFHDGAAQGSMGNAEAGLRNDSAFRTPHSAFGSTLHSRSEPDGWVPSASAILEELSRGPDECGVPNGQGEVPRSEARGSHSRRSSPRFWSWKALAIVLPLCGAAAVAALTWLPGDPGFVHPSGQVTAVAHGADLVAVAGDSTVVLWQRTSQRTLGELAPLPPFPILSIDISPDGRWLAACGPSDQFWIWDLHAEGNPGYPLTVSDNGCTVVRFSPDGRRLAVVMHDEGSVSLWAVGDRVGAGISDGDSGTGVPPVAEQTPWRHVADLDSLPKCPSGAVSAGYSAAWSPDGRFLAVGGAKAWQVFAFEGPTTTAGRRVAMRDAIDGDVKGVALVGDRLLTLIDNGGQSRAVVWDWQAEETLAGIPVAGFFHEAREYPVTLTADGSRAVLPGDSAMTWEIDTEAVTPLRLDATTTGVRPVPGEPSVLLSVEESRQDRAVFVEIDGGW